MKRLIMKIIFFLKKDKKQKVKDKRNKFILYLLPLFLAGSISVYFIQDLSNFYNLNFEIPAPIDFLSLSGLPLPDREAETYFLIRAFHSIQILFEYFIVFYIIVLIIYNSYKKNVEEQSAEIARGYRQLSGTEARNMIYLFIEEEKQLNAKKKTLFNRALSFITNKINAKEV